MLPYDSKGEYTPEEVKDALSGVNGSRQLSYRYARLNQNNDYIEDIDYIQSCSIENNALADIKRTARFNILDTGTINYLQDRIMPYIRLHMPKDKGYYDAIEAQQPSVWWKFDEPVGTNPSSSQQSAIPNGNTYMSRDTAYSLGASTTKKYWASSQGSPAFQIQTGSGTLRSEIWFSIETVDSRALLFDLAKDYLQTGQVADYLAEVYYAKSTDVDATLELLWTHTVSTTGTHYFPVAIPRLGVYYLRLVATSATLSSPTVTIGPSRRFEDSSGNGHYGVSDMAVSSASALIAAGSAALKPLAGSFNINTEDFRDPVDITNGLTLNWWDSATTSAGNHDLWWDFRLQEGFARIYARRFATEWEFSVHMESIDGGANYQGSVDFPLSKFNGTGAHMFTFVCENGKPAKMYIDGVSSDELVDPNGNVPLINEGNTIVGMKIDVFTDGNMVVDDVSVYNTALPSTVISGIYADAQKATTPRSGYVDWRQGVFVLSSPTRTMADGNTVTREVEGYDQLVVLKEDSFDYRYSVRAGAKYTEAISAVVQSSKAVSDYPIDETWVLEGNAVVNSEDSVRLDTVDANQVAIYSNMVTLQDIQVSAKMDAPTSPSTARTIMSVNYWTTVNGEAKQMWIEKSGTNIEFVYNGFGYISTWNAINDGFWRMRESNGFFYWETSADRKTWVERRKVKLTDDTFADANISFVADHGQAVIGSGAHEISFTGRGKSTMDITKSESKLPTAMEWEPGTPKLTIVNDLLDAINYQSATYSEGGAFLGRPYVSPSNRTPQYRYATDAESVITGDVDQTVDLFKVPNKWIVVVSDPDRPSLVGEYVNADPHSPTSTVSRGRTIVDYRTEQAAPDQLTLDAQAARLAFEASQVYESIEFQTALMPIHQNNDVYELVIDGLGIDGKYSEQTWSMELKNGAIMSHKVRRVVNV